MNFSQILVFFQNNVLYLLIFVLFLVAVLLIQSVSFAVSKSKIRKDAVKRSRSVISGQMVEQVAPFLPGFPCNPCDAHFLGKPVDFIAFSGLTETDSVDEILFIEVKTGKSELNPREKQVQKAIEEGRVRYVKIRL